MKSLALICSLALFLPAGNPDARTVLHKMYDKYATKWYHSFTFVQTTDRYRNDSLINTSTWYEAIEFPAKFRIDFGDPANGNAVIFKDDSAYNFRAGKPGPVRADKNDLTFLLGGLYFYPFGKVLDNMKNLGYDLQQCHEDEWKGQPVYVIGADSAGEKVNQLWVDKEKLLVVRFIKFEDGRKEEGWFEEHKPFGGGWSETKCTFYINDKLLQVEKYYDCKANIAIDPKVFEPAEFGKTHWYKKDSSNKN